MNSGKLRHKVIIQKNMIVRDTAGQETDTWIDLFNVWASITPLNGKEFIAGLAEQSRVTHDIRIRHRSMITPELRVKHLTHTYVIMHILPSEKNTEIHLFCKEVYNV
jgi:SPP1 family predicted phage head-tail adaptor